MIRLKAFLISIILVLITLVILDKTYIKKIEDYYKVNDNSVRYSTSYEKYKSKDIILENMTPKTLLLLGSSELTTTINENYHPKKIFNYNDFNIMQVGVGNSQNIIHAATIGSIGNDVANNQIVMIQSIQWFDNKNGILKDAFLSSYLVSMFIILWLMIELVKKLKKSLSIELLNYQLQIKS